MAKITDEELIKIIGDEMSRSIGMDGDEESEELQSSRQQALNYYKGLMPDMPSLENRSSFVSTDLHDAMQQLMPELVEVMMEEDLCTFVPMNDADIEAAQQESDFINYVINEQNSGFELWNAAFWDALMLKRGFFVWSWDEPEMETQVFTSVGLEDYNSALESVPDQLSDASQNEDGTVNFTLTRPKQGKVCIDVYPPDDVTVSYDTVKLGKGTYCAFRTRMRRYELLEAGYSEDQVMEIPRYDSVETGIDLARDTAGEQNARINSGSSTEDYDIVEITYHYVKVWEDGEDKLLRVVTASGNTHQLTEDSILERKEVKQVDAASICAFPIPHRFYGQSLSDIMAPIQRVKTALTRMTLDQGYYALNQRYELPESHVSKHTLNDLLANRPGAPVRTKLPGGIMPLQSGSLGFDPLNAIEHFSVVSEQRTGIMRSGMGLNPDALHETAAGMTAMMDKGQVRTRYIVRNFIETGIKDLFLGVHNTLRENATMAMTARLRGKIVSVNPASWGVRDTMAVEIGNAGGREYDVAVIQQVMALQEKLVQAQGGTDGAFVSQENIQQAAKRLAQRSGVRKPELYFKEPAPAAPQEPQDPSQAPEALALQAEMNNKMQIEQMKAQMQSQIDTAKNTTQAQLDQAKAQADLQIQQQKLQLEQMKFQAEMQFKEQTAQAELAIKQREIELNYEIELRKLEMQGSLRTDQVDKELDLKAQIANLEAELENKRIEVENENEKLRILAEQRTTSIDNPPPSVNLTDVYLGGDPG
jgi:hypothetical protein